MKHLAEAMHGRCGFTPNIPNGSIFWFQVPCSSVSGFKADPLPCAHSQLLMVDPVPRAHSDTHTQLQMVDPVPRTVNQQANQQMTSKALFVDDDRMAHFVVSRMLRRMGIELEWACDGMACLQVLKASTAHCFSWYVDCLIACHDHTIFSVSLASLSLIICLTVLSYHICATVLSHF